MAEIQPTKRKYIAPYIVIPLLVIMVSMLGYIIYRDTPLFYTLKVCDNGNCTTTICQDVRVDGNEIVIYESRRNHKVKQILVLTRDENAIVTPTYRK